MENKISKFELIISVSLLVIGFSSCNNFLSIQPKTQIGDNTLWESTGNADLFLNGIYGQIPGPFNTDDPLENFSDNSMNGINGTPSRTLYANSVYTSSNAPSYSASWGQLYADIRKCNLFLEKVAASNISDSTWEKQRLAEARFLRAYFYQLLWIQYGGVPIITDVLNRNTQGDEIFKARSTDDETFKFITDECAAIADDLPIHADAGRASRGAALTLQAWCELFEASPLKNPSNDKTKWELAATTNRKVIDLDAYGLFSDYGTLFYEDNNNNEEVIFAKQYLGGTPLGGSREGLQGPWHVGGIQLAYGGVDPTQELVDTYEMANGLPITDPASGYDPQNPYEGREKRFYESIVYDGSTWAGSEMVMKQGVGSSNATDLSSANEATNTGYYLRKGLNPKYAINGNNTQNSANFIIFRYAEVLLSYAEAQNETVGPDPSVYKAINQVRARSDLPPVPDGLSQDEMRIKIHRERRVELAFEGKRLYDLFRLKLAEKNLNGNLHAMLIEKESNKWQYNVIPAPDGERTFHANQNYLLPIPQSAIDQNSKLKQNPNY